MKMYRVTYFCPLKQIAIIFFTVKETESILLYLAIHLFPRIYGTQSPVIDDESFSKRGLPPRKLP